MTLTHLSIEDSPLRLNEHGPLFILGCPRSGTTFLSNCLAPVPGLEEFVGVIVPPRLIHLIARHSSQGGDPTDLMHCVREIFWQSFWRRRYFKRERAVQWLAKNLTLREFLAKPTLDNSLFCYKEPFLGFAAKDFAQYFPNSKFIHIIRDGRDNADSFERTYPQALTDEVLASDQLAFSKNSEIGFWRPHGQRLVPWWIPEGQEENFLQESRYGRCVWLWKELTQRGQALQTLLPRDRYLEVRYEDLASDPMKTSEILLSFLGKPMTTPMRRQLKKAFASSVGIGGKNQSPEKIEAANRIAGDLLKSLGYST